MSDAEGVTAEAVDLAEVRAAFVEFADGEMSGIDMYQEICSAAAEDSEMMRLMLRAPRGQRRPILLLAAVHELLLAGPTDDATSALARWYPSVSGTAQRTGDVYPHFRRVVEEHRHAIEAVLATRATQTNEVNRSALWFAALPATVADDPGLAEHPVAVIELGASAGLNLLFDRYRYDFRDGVERGDPGAALLLDCTVRRGAPPLDDRRPDVVWRAGIDLDPVDVDDDAAVAWTRACLWPEQPERIARFDLAVAMARRDRPVVHRGDIVERIAAVAGGAPADAHLVILNSWVLTYLERARRQTLATAISEVASSRRALTWVSAEAAGVVGWMVDDPAPDPSDGFVTLVGLRRWRDGTEGSSGEVIARCDPHLRWLDWLIG